MSHVVLIVRSAEEIALHNIEKLKLVVIVESGGKPRLLHSSAHRCSKGGVGYVTYYCFIFHSIYPKNQYSANLL